MADVKVPVRTTYDGSGFSKLRKDSKKTSQTIEDNFAKVGKAIAGAFAIREIAEFGKESFLMAAEAERLGRATDNLARRFGVSGNVIVDSIRETSGETISRLEAMRIANKAMLLGVVDSEDQFAEMTQIAVVLGRAMGQDATKSIDDFTTALGRQSPMILDNLGINLKLSEAYERYAKRLGKTADDLSDAEKKQAFMNEALEKGRTMVEEIGPVTDDLGGSVERLTSNWADLRVEMGQNISVGGRLTNWLADLIGGLADSKREQREAFEAMQEYGLEAMAVWGNMGELVNATEILAEAQARGAAEAEAAADATGDLADSQDDLVAAAEAAAIALEEQTKRLKEINAIRKEFARDLISIDEDAAEQSEAVWNDYFEAEANEWQSHNKRMAEIKKRGAADIAKIDKKLAKDLAKLAKDLQRDLAKVDKDEDRQIKRLKQDAARERRATEKRRQIDALADERLFQFELEQLAAQGEGNRILELLKRREIEEQITREKAQVEAQIENERLGDEIERIKEAAEERREQLRLDADERSQLLQDEAAEEKDIRQQRLAEELADEETSHQERLAELRTFRDDKLAEIEEGRLEAIAELGKELAESEELTKKELAELVPVAGSLGEQAGKAFAEGLGRGMETLSRIRKMLAGTGSGMAATTGPPGSTATPAELALSGPMAGTPLSFQQGGTVPGPLGAPRLAVVHGGETVTPAGGARVQITINNPVFGNAVTEDEVMGFFQQYTDDILGPALG